MATYRYVLTDRSGFALGELQNATDASFQRTLNGVDTATFTLPLADQLARDLVTADGTGQIPERLLKVYRQGEGDPHLLFHGVVVDAEAVFTASGGTVQVNAASPMWTLSKRYAGKDASGAPRTVKPTIGQRGAIAVSLIGSANGEGPTGVRTPAFTPDTTQASIDDISYRSIAELVTELSLGQLGAISSGGFDFSLDPIEYTAGAICDFRIGPRAGDTNNLAAHLIGRTLDNVVFELGPGTRGSAMTARLAITRGGMANAIFHTLGEGQSILAVDDPSAGTRGRYEAVLTDDITDSGYRQELLNVHRAARRDPRRVITFDPAPEEQSPNVPRAWVDYRVGDVVWLRAVDSTGEIVINAGLRIYSIATSVDADSGVGRHTLTVVAE